MSRFKLESLDEALPDQRVLLALIAYSDEESRLTGFSQKSLAELTQLSTSDVAAALKVLQWHGHIALECAGGNTKGSLYVLTFDREPFRLAALNWRMRFEPEWQRRTAETTAAREAEKREQEAQLARRREEWKQAEHEREERDRERLTLSDGEYRLVLSLVTWADDRGYVDGPRFNEVVTYSGLSFDDASAIFRSLIQRGVIRASRSYAAVERNRYQLLFSISEELRLKARAQFHEIDARLEEQRRNREQFVTVNNEGRKEFILSCLMSRRDLDNVAAVVLTEYADFGVSSQRQLFHFLYELQSEKHIQLFPKDPDAPNVARIQLLVPPAMVATSTTKDGADALRVAQPND